MQNKLIVAPHSDDAILSLGGILCKSKDYFVLNIFSTCAWSILPNLNNPKKITKKNNLEEKKALSKINIDYKLMKLPEALLRGYKKWNDDLNIEKDHKIIKKINSKLNKILPKVKEIYFPLAIGSHTDHQLIYQIGIKMIKNQPRLKNKTIFFYEDLPYSINSEVKKKINQINVNSTFNVTPNYVPINETIEQKCKLLAIYKSQLKEKDIVKVKQYAHRLNNDQNYYECLWKVNY